MDTHSLAALLDTHALIHNMGCSLADSDYRYQYHTDLSPLGWHVGHCSFIETVWLRDRVLGDSTITDAFDWLYIPENILKPKRGPALPPRDEHLDWCSQLNKQNHELLANPDPVFSAHELNRNNYLLKFILQHHSQHAETMAMVLIQRQLQMDHSDHHVTHSLAARAITDDGHVSLPASRYCIGNTDNSEAFDNEVPLQEISLADTLISHLPVSNGNWLAFIEDGGYRETRWWSEAGNTWRKMAKVESPETWVRNTHQHWFEVSTQGCRDLNENSAVSGINLFEANAFINWLNTTAGLTYRARLPHEYEWEAADQAGLLSGTGQVWEWCHNYFHPYPGFSPFPYDNYSKPWFDQNHVSLRGGSEFTRPSIRRSSFRNFYNPDKRHIFSGLRLVYEG